ncbi:putative tyrosine-protein phosphatase non-receptor type 2 isoform X2 [Penaeus vannamei]|uniref:protein-tyrosine-phosphatase n=1 Tax=Penaeus vannamei TaxID=6689 RepID=A0A3R7PHA9_PENVA|nr:putative tyrosine-protein phosphatase non-receptor type 2 isoform X2 [Penaeus vannamei]
MTVPPASQPQLGILLGFCGWLASSSLDAASLPQPQAALHLDAWVAAGRSVRPASPKPELSRGLSDSGQGKVLEVLLDMRRQRMGLIQTPDQLKFSYQAIIYGAHKLNEMNGKEPVEESSSEEPSLADDLPPQPPPRTDSLTRSMIESQLAQELQEGINSCPCLLDAPARPLPAEPATDGSGPETSPLPSPVDDMPNDVRQRKRRERIEATAAKVKNMVDKQRANEQWQEKKRPSTEEETPAKRPRV